MDARRRVLTRRLWAAAFSLALPLAFPFRAGDLRFDLGMALGWIALIPFALMLRGLRPRAAFVWGACSGTAGFVGILFWLYVVVRVFGHAPVVVGLGAILLLSAYCGVHLGLAAALCAKLEPAAGWAAALVLPASWVVAEHLRSFDLFGGFPWAYLGYSAHTNGPILQLAALGGVYGLSFLLATFASLVSRRRISAAFALLALSHAAGVGLRLASPDADAGSRPPLRAALVQANIPQDQKWAPESAREAFELHLETARLAAKTGPLDLILWPETSAPFLLEIEQTARDELAALARETQAAVVLGGMGIERGQGRDVRFYNSVFAVAPDGRFVDRYDKSKLVPFGEYVPLRAALGFLSGIATGLAPVDVTPGPGARPLDGLGVLSGDHAVAPLICYEVIYPKQVRQAVQRGARVLLNVTNDAWYGRTSAPHQFLAIAATRSAEHGVPMLRAANTGVSAVVDSGGWVREQTEIFEQSALAAVVPAARASTTFYTRAGDWVVWVSWAFLLVIGGRAVARDRSRRSRDSGTAVRPGGPIRRAAEASLTSTRSATD